MIILCSRIETRGKLNLLDLNIHTENFYRDFFNKLYELKLANGNVLKKNIKAIDLIDKENKIIIQVSSTKTKIKIDNSLSKIDMSLYGGYTFNFISIAKSASDLRNKKYKTPQGITFDPTKHIYDKDSILTDCLNLETDKLKNIYSFFKQEFELDSKLEKEIPSSNKPHYSECNNIDINRKKGITQRSELIVKEIKKYLVKDFNKDITDTCFSLISADSGEGKTTIAIEVAHKIGAKFPITIWINAELPIQSQIISFITKNKLIEKNTDITNDEIIELFNTNCILLIFDNVRYLKDIETYIPKYGQSRVIITSTNRALQKEEYLKSFVLQKLTTQDAENILLQGIEQENKESRLIENIIQLLEYSPFGLELANSYMKIHPELSLTFIYDDITRTTETIKRNADNQFGIINTAPSITYLFHKTFLEFDKNNSIDNVCLDLIKYARLLNQANEGYNYDTFQELLKLDKANAGDERIFSEIKQRLYELGLAKYGNNIFTIHSFVINYAKELPNEIKHIATILDYFYAESKKILEFMFSFGLWIDCSNLLNSYGILMLFFKNHFSSYYNSKENRPRLYMLMDEFCIFRKYKELLQLCDDASFVSNDDKFPLYMKAIAKHQLEDWEGALAIYQTIIYEDHNLINIINSAFYSGHILSHLKEYENALHCYTEAGKLLQEAEIIYKENPIELLILQARYYSYLLNLYIITNNKIEEEKKKKEYNSKLTEILKIQGITDATGLKDPNIYPFRLKMEMLNNEILKPATIKFKVKYVKRCNSK